MRDGLGRVPVFRLPPKRYTAAAVFSMAVHGMLAFGAFEVARQALPFGPFRVPFDSGRTATERYVVVLPPPPLTTIASPDSIAPTVHARRLTAGARQGTPEGRVERPALLETAAAPFHSVADSSADPPSAAAPPPADPGIHAQAVGAGEIASVAGAGATLIDYARADQRDQIRVGEIEPKGPKGDASLGDGDHPGTSRVAELVGPAGTACPELRRAKSRQHSELTVSVGFDVDDRGAVDQASLHVVQSPAQPQTEHRFYSHIYAVAGSAKVDGSMPDLDAAYDSVVRRDVRDHVAGLQFRPALRNGQPVRSSVLVSCQSP